MERFIKTTKVVDTDTTINATLTETNGQVVGEIVRNDESVKKIRATISAKLKYGKVTKTVVGYFNDNNNSQIKYIIVQDTKLKTVVQVIETDYVRSLLNDISYFNLVRTFGGLGEDTARNRDEYTELEVRVGKYKIVTKYPPVFAGYENYYRRPATTVYFDGVEVSYWCWIEVVSTDERIPVHKGVTTYVRISPFKYGNGYGYRVTCFSPAWKTVVGNTLFREKITVRGDMDGIAAIPYSFFGENVLENGRIREKFKLDKSFDALFLKYTVDEDSGKVCKLFYVDGEEDYGAYDETTRLILPFYNYYDCADVFLDYDLKLDIVKKVYKTKENAIAAMLPNANLYIYENKWILNKYRFYGPLDEAKDINYFVKFIKKSYNFFGLGYRLILDTDICDKLSFSYIAEILSSTTHEEFTLSLIYDYDAKCLPNTKGIPFDFRQARALQIIRPNLFPRTVEGVTQVEEREFKTLFPRGGIPYVSLKKPFCPIDKTFSNGNLALFRDLFDEDKFYRDAYERAYYEYSTNTFYYVSCDEVSELVSEAKHQLGVLPKFVFDEDDYIDFGTKRAVGYCFYSQVPVMSLYGKWNYLEYGNQFKYDAEAKILFYSDKDIYRHFLPLIDPMAIETVKDANGNVLYSNGTVNATTNVLPFSSYDIGFDTTIFIPDNASITPSYAQQLFRWVKKDAPNYLASDFDPSFSAMLNSGTFRANMMLKLIDAIKAIYEFLKSNRNKLYIENGTKVNLDDNALMAAAENYFRYAIGETSYIYYYYLFVSRRKDNDIYKIKIKKIKVSVDNKLNVSISFDEPIEIEDPDESYEVTAPPPPPPPPPPPMVKSTYEDNIVTYTITPDAGAVPSIVVDGYKIIRANIGKSMLTKNAQVTWLSDDGGDSRVGKIEIKKLNEEFPVTVQIGKTVIRTV